MASITPLTLTSGATHGMSAQEVENLTRNVQTLFARLHPRDASQPESEIYALIQALSLDQRVQALGQLYTDIDSVLGQYKAYAREKESKQLAYIKDARKVAHGALVAASTAFLNAQGLEGIVLNVDRGAPLRIVRADVLLGTNEDPALPLSMVVAGLDRACAEAGVELPAAVVKALPRHFAAMRSTLSAKPAVVKKQKM